MLGQGSQTRLDEISAPVRPLSNLFGGIPSLNERLKLRLNDRDGLVEFGPRTNFSIKAPIGQNPVSITINVVAWVRLSLISLRCQPP